MTAAPARRGRLHVAVLTHNALEHTRRCFLALQAHTPAPFGLYVLDNASTDGTRDWLQGLAMPGLRVRLSDTNTGVPGGRNRLLRWILEEAAEDDWIVFLDNDIEVGPGWTVPFDGLLRAFPETGIAGVVGHRILVHDDGRTLLEAPQATAPVDVVSGGFACWIRAGVARAVGGFDEELGLFWHEDDDLCVRAKALGVPVFAVPEAAMTHHEHASGVAVPDLEDGGSRRNQAYLARKWRELGLVDEDGWIRSPDPWDYVDRERRMQWAAAGSGGARRRLELDRVAWDLRLLARVADPRAFLVERPVAATPLHADLLEHLVRRGALAPERARVVAAALAEGAAAAPPPAPEHGPGPGAGLVRGEDWDDPAFDRAATRVYGDAWRHMREARDRRHWEEVQAYRALEAHGMLRRDRCGLVPGTGAAALQFALAAGAGMVVAADRYRDDADLPGDFRERPGQAARVPYPAERLHLVEQDPRCLQLGDDRFDFVCAVGALSRWGRPEDRRRALREWARVVAPGGLVVVSSDVVVDRPADPLLPTLGELAGEAARCGYEAVVNPSAAVTGDTRAGGTGGLLERSRGRTVGTELLVLRVTERAREAGPEQAPVVLRARPPRTPVSTPVREIGIDARTLDQAGSVARGIGHYTLYHLEALAHARPDWRFLCFGEGDPPACLQGLLELPHVEHRPVDAYRPGSLDLVHLPDPMNLSVGFDSPFRVFREACTSVMFHDLIPMRQYFGAWHDDLRHAYRARLGQLAGSEALVLANSAFTARDLVATTGLPADRVVPVLAGYNAPPASPALDPSAVRHRLGLDGPYFLHVGALDPHKNFPAVLDAFRKGGFAGRARLVVVGRMDDPMRAAAVACLRAGDRDVVFPGFLGREELVALYREAAALLFLSRDEGFGFPALEAMGTGCPVVASHCASLPEVVGGAGIVLDPDDGAGLRAAMERLLADPALRARLAARGRRRAAEFTWDAVAGRTLESWEKRLSGHAAPALALPRR